MARRILFTFGILCLLPVIAAAGFWLFSLVWNQIQNHSSGPTFMIFGIYVEWPRILTVTAVGVALLVLGVRMKTAKLRH